MTVFASTISPVNTIDAACFSVTSTTSISSPSSFSPPPSETLSAGEYSQVKNAIFSMIVAGTRVEVEQSMHRRNSVTEFFLHLLHDARFGQITVKLPRARLKSPLGAVPQEYRQPQLPSQ